MFTVLLVLSTVFKCISSSKIENILLKVFRFGQCFTTSYNYSIVRLCKFYQLTIFLKRAKLKMTVYSLHINEISTLPLYI